MSFANIISTGVYVPEKVITNGDLGRILGEDINPFVTQVLGIHERHVCADDESTADLATNASRHALAAAQLDASKLDLIILATDTPEQLSPATSVVVQHRLGAVHAGTFDVNSACAGFVTALDNLLLMAAFMIIWAFTQEELTCQSRVKCLKKTCGRKCASRRSILRT